MKHEYYPQGVCPMKLEFELDGDTVKNIEFTGGCNGNLKAIATLVDGWKADDIIEKLDGNTCGFKQTSCADQLAQALKKAKAGEI
ncbi:MAG: TIGR03905 family TSCPD domain-containing protein [Clostridia bacterium]|nr:TIGR03905 family TSCPD domain-containing protein [Clostridia bacterium]